MKARATNVDIIETVNKNVNLSGDVTIVKMLKSEKSRKSTAMKKEMNAAM
jgi:hypothetical protein